MALVYMYTFYNDLFDKPTQENLKIQIDRDIIIRNAMLQQKYKGFPMSEYSVGHLFSFFKEITRQNSVLNILLTYKLNNKEGSAIIIRNNKIDMYFTKEEAINSIIKNQTIE